jgi:hypothetical protein
MNVKQPPTPTHKHNHLLMFANILMLKYDWFFATHFHVGVGTYVDMLLDDLCVFETTTTCKHIVQFKWSPQTYMFSYTWLLMMKEQQNVTSHDTTIVMLEPKI